MLAVFRLGNEFSEEQKRRNFDYYDPRTTGDSSLSASVQSIIAAEIGREHQALEYFQYATRPGGLLANETLQWIAGPGGHDRIATVERKPQAMRLRVTWPS